ncbi:DUF1460 domain-containing protein [Mycobacterium sp. MYCO198283]|uniref:N-acetylmuramoyl-L-alanine amidase-like domain-containing protein n=1 Tax=Mycobacterium sp. MYCO198283 TaxID=2883505 RepID=UPI001E478955|nr:N-acetylmuramoyl-L-alanine amidase-like domain-containing protein [Mycobacterium sp. MYCO198283]MCG5434300.1 DUF1460 domain-containing protein [Mycobacterium sp. MYCO198283]
MMNAPGRCAVRAALALLVLVGCSPPDAPTPSAPPSTASTSTAPSAAAVPPPTAASALPAVVQIDAGSRQLLDQLLILRGETAPADRSEVLSRQFLGTPYVANTLVGSESEPEQLVVDLARVDCFTYADYVEAAKRADTRDGYLAALTQVRYKNGVVSFPTRRHFFTDWAAAAPAVATDITTTLGPHAVSTQKNLNAKDDGGVYLPGLPIVSRTVTYLPRALVDDAVIGALRTGDYIGAYAEDGGLDVTHVGIFISGPDGPVLRNASSRAQDMSVVDSPFRDYLATVPGIVVLRPVQ